MQKSADKILKNMDMAPKNSFESLGEPSDEEVDEAYLQEIRAVDERLDELRNALDCFEQRTDTIIEQLKELLHSNREMRQELAQAAVENPTSQTPPKTMNMEASSSYNSKKSTD